MLEVCWHVFVVVLFISSFLSSFLQIDSVLMVLTFWVFFRLQDSVVDLRVKVLLKRLLGN